MESFIIIYSNNIFYYSKIIKTHKMNVIINNKEKINEFKLNFYNSWIRNKYNFKIKMDKKENILKNEMKLTIWISFKNLIMINYSNYFQL
jgi:hypothetical protein